MQIHFKQAERLQKEYQDTAEGHGFGMSAEDSAQDGMTKNMLDLSNAMNRNDTLNAATAAMNATNAVLQEMRDGIVEM